MINNVKFIFYIFLFLFTLSCTKKKLDVEPIYTEEEFTKITSELKAVNPVGENAIPFHEYSPNANRVISKVFIFKRLRFYAIGFDSVLSAQAEAKRLNQYYSKNFLLDQVEGEPELEDMAISLFKGQNPNRKVQKIPKHENHSEGTHGSSNEIPAEHSAPHH
jgi:hypothetical protein